MSGDARRFGWKRDREKAFIIDPRRTAFLRGLGQRHFIHYQTDPQELQRCIPYHLDLYDGSAFVSLVAFTMRGMRPRFGGSLARFSSNRSRLITFSTFALRHTSGGAGDLFHAGWLSSRLATWLGPCSFGLPYRFAQMNLPRNHQQKWRRKIEADAGSFDFCAIPRRTIQVLRSRFPRRILLERYTAFTQFGKCRRFFRIWHEPWRQVPAEIQIATNRLIQSTGRWWRSARCIGSELLTRGEGLDGLADAIGDAGIPSIGYE